MKRQKYKDETANLRIFFSATVMLLVTIICFNLNGFGQKVNIKSDDDSHICLTFSFEYTTGHGKSYVKGCTIKNDCTKPIKVEIDGNAVEIWRCMVVPTNQFTIKPNTSFKFDFQIRGCSAEDDLRVASFLRSGLYVGEFEKLKFKSYVLPY